MVSFCYHLWIKLTTNLDLSEVRSVLNSHSVKAAKQGDDIFSTKTFVTRFNRHQITILSTGKEKHAEN